MGQTPDGSHPTTTTDASGTFALHADGVVAVVVSCRYCRTTRVATLSGEVFYYISQRAEQISFLPQKEIDRRVVAVYFDKNRRVQRLADYGLKDGKIFDSISRTTPSGGVEQNYLAFVFKITKF